MQVTLKAVKSFNGPDGECFTAKICFDGKSVGEVSNEGWGGCNRYTLNAENLRALKAAARLAGHDGPECEDVFVEDLMNERDALRFHKRTLKKGIYYCTAWVRYGQFESGYISLRTKASLEGALERNKATLIKLFEGEVENV